MKFQQEYLSKLQNPEEAVKVVKSGDMVQYNSFNGVPPALDMALSQRRDELQGVIINTSVALYPLHTISSDPTGEHFIYHSWHSSDYDRQFSSSGNFFYVPYLYYEMPIDLSRRQILDVAMLHVAPMDEDGYFNFGPSVAQAKPIIDSSSKVIVEVNKNMPVVYGEFDHRVHISEVDIIVEGDNPAMLTIPAAEPEPLDEKIAALVMEEIEDGACIQLGIGKMPNAVGKLIAQSDLKDLGVHTEMLADAHMVMYETGRVTGKNKTINNGAMVFGFAMGSKELYDFIDRNPICQSYPVSYINLPHNIAKNPKVIAINNAIEVDLFSQINSESVGTRHISGTGGQVDFMLGSFMSQGGKGIICMSSTFTDKKGNIHSRIRPTLPPGTIVTVPRTIAHYIITEYGTINIKGKSTWQRAEALISIAHPDFRDELVSEAQHMGIWRRSNRISQ
ncbi:acetyl-CoA hydrolase/transferase family protein [Syntrophomonas curvata]